MKVKSESEVPQSCPTLCDPMDCSLPGSSAHGIFQLLRGFKLFYKKTVCTVQSTFYTETRCLIFFL